MPTAALSVAEHDLLAALRHGGRPHRAIHLTVPRLEIPLHPVLRELGIAPRLVEAIARVAVGAHAGIGVGGVHGECWRVSWSRRGVRPRWAGVLDARTRLFVTTASGEDALLGFAMAAVGGTWAMPYPGFDGEWAALLGTYGIEGAPAFRAGRLRDIALPVLDWLAIDEFSSRSESRPWRFLMVRDEGELPALDEPPAGVRRALDLAAAPLGAGSLLADFGRFTHASAIWRRGVAAVNHTSYVGKEADLGARAARAGLHVVLSGPAATGKSTCAGDVLGALDVADPRAPDVSVALEDHPSVDRLLGAVDADGRWVDGPLRAAMTADEGAGRPLHLACTGPIAPAVQRLLDLVLRETVLPAGIVPGAPQTTIGARFRLLLEVTTPGADDATVPGGDGGRVAQLRFAVPTGDRLGWMLGSLAPDAPDAWRSLAVWTVDDAAMAVEAGVLPRVPTVPELCGWLRAAGAIQPAGHQADWVGALSVAVRLTWGSRIPGAQRWWDERTRHHADAIARYGLLQAECVGSGQPADAAAIGLDEWARSLEVRATIDRLTRDVSPRTHLSLPSLGHPTLGDALGTYAPGSPFCQTAIDPSGVGTPLDALAVTVAVAAHERAHARWSGTFPDDLRRPGEEAPPAEHRAYDLRKRAFDVLEDMRMERLLDAAAFQDLAAYRRRAAEVLTGWDLEHAPATQSERMLLLLYRLVRRITLEGAAAWVTATLEAETLRLDPSLATTALSLLCDAELAGESRDVVPELARQLADLLLAADG